MTKYRIMDILPFATLSGGIAYVSIASGIMEGKSIPVLRWYKKNAITLMVFDSGSVLHCTTVQYNLGVD